MVTKQVKMKKKDNDKIKKSVQTSSACVRDVFIQDFLQTTTTKQKQQQQKKQKTKTNEKQSSCYVLLPASFFDL